MWPTKFETIPILVMNSRAVICLARPSSPLLKCHRFDEINASHLHIANANENHIHFRTYIPCKIRATGIESDVEWQAVACATKATPTVRSPCVCVLSRSQSLSLAIVQCDCHNLSRKINLNNLLMCRICRFYCAGPFQRLRIIMRMCDCIWCVAQICNKNTNNDESDFLFWCRLTMNTREDVVRAPPLPFVRRDKVQ